MKFPSLKSKRIGVGSVGAAELRLPPNESMNERNQYTPRSQTYACTSLQF